MVLPALVGALSGAPTAGAGEESDWPPQAWHDGDISELSLVDLALLASDSLPTPDNRRELAAGLSPLDGMPPEHTELVRVVLEGLAKARWHQVQAMRDLSEEQRTIVAAADPDAPVPDGWEGVMAAVDHGELGKALLALEASSTRVREIYESLHRDASPGVAQSLAEAMEVPIPESSPALPDAPSALTTALVSQVTDVGLTPDELTHLQGSLDEIPPEARSAIHLILEGLLPFAAGAPTDPGPALVELGAAVDAARETLLIWSTAAMAQQVHHVLTGQGIEIPDADADRPPLHFGVPRLRDPDALLPPAPSLPDALRNLALAFGDQETAQNAQEKTQPVMDVLPQSQQDVLAQMFSQAARYMRAQEAASQAPMPSALAQDPGLLSGWIDSLDEGFPEPGSMEADALLGARSFLEAQLEAALSREDLMTAIQDAVEELTPKQQSSSSPLPDEPGAPDDPAPMPMSGPAEEAGVECLEGLGIIDNLRPYLVIEPCAGDTQWDWSEHKAVFVIDMGGNDTYQGPFAGAPFSVGAVPITETPIISPLAFHLDLGGSDFYNATGHDCALGAACGVLGVDVPPMAVLIDWDGDGVVAHNQFHSDDRSQGFVSETATGLLIERVGRASELTSEFEAGGRSQGVSIISNTINILAPDSGIMPVGALLRLVGSHGQASSGFTAGDVAQGSREEIGSSLYPANAALLNVAGIDTVSHDQYTAQQFGQGAAKSAQVTNPQNEAPFGASLFADIAGPGGRSDDVYSADDASRAYGPGAFFLDLLLPDLAEQDEVITMGPTPDPALPPDGELKSIFVEATVNSTGPRSSSDDTYILTQGDAGHGMASRPDSPSNRVRSTLFLNVGGTSLYDYPGHVECTVTLPALASLPAKDCMWVRPEPNTAGTPTGMDTDALRDEDGDFLPYFVEDLLDRSDQEPESPHPTGRRILIDSGANDVFLNDTYAFILTLAGTTIYGPGFSAGVQLDLAGDDVYLGRSAAATGSAPSATEEETARPAAQGLLSFALDLTGDDIYDSNIDGSLGFGIGGAAGLLFDLGGSDSYNGTSYTQGVGVGGGLGVLLDLKTPVTGLPPQAAGDEVNRFRVDGNRSQGHGESAGVGILFANGDHNEFDDGEGGAPSSHGTGNSVNTGQNVGPVITQWAVEGGGVSWTNSSNDEFPLLKAGQSYTFSATAVDEDGDRMEFCWTFEDTVCQWAEGKGTVEDRKSVAWNVVPTDARQAGIHETWVFNGSLEVKDAGGKGDSSDLLPIAVENVPLEVNGNLRGPSMVRAGERVALQLPFVGEARHDLPAKADPAVEVNWGSGPPERFSATAVDWAASSNGGRISLQGGFPEAFDAPPLVDPSQPITNAIGAGSTRLDTGQPDHVLLAPAMIVVDFEGPRQVREVVLDASLVQSEGRQVQLAVEAVRSDGTTFPLGPETVKLTGTGPDRHEWNLVEFSDLQGLLIRQVVPPNEQRLFQFTEQELEDEKSERPSYQFHIHQISARGPGAFKQWETGGSYEINYTVLDAFGGRNGITQALQVRSAAGEGLLEPSIELVDVDGRGATKTASLAINRSYEFSFDVRHLQNNDSLCVFAEVDAEQAEQWCHGSDDGDQLTILMAWDEPGSYNITATPNQDGTVGEDKVHLGTMHVEEAIDLRLDSDDTLILFMTFNHTADTWYENMPYQALLDAGGNDRYFGRVAASMPAPTTQQQLPGVPPPQLAVNVGGDDLYVDVSRWGPLGSQVTRKALDVGAPLNSFPGGNAIGWVDCHSNTPPRLDPGDCVFLDADNSGTASTGDILLVDIPGADVAAGGVMDPTSQGVGTQLRTGAFFPVYEDIDGNGAFSHGDIIYLDDPSWTGVGHGILSQGDLQVSGDGFGAMMAQSSQSPTDLEPVALNFCFHDTSGDGSFDAGEPVYLAASGQCTTVQPLDVRAFVPPPPGRTQAFATHFGVALLMDANGDDTYVAGGEAQAAATRGGVAALVSLGGTDRFNPLPANHQAVAGASATEETPTDREVFRGGRPIGIGPDMVQGAAEDGVALFVTAGGPLGSAGSFHAGDRSQGHGVHQMRSVDGYAFPGAKQCNNPIAPASHMAALCLLGISNVRDPANPNNLAFYTNTTPLTPFGLSDSNHHLWCSLNAGPPAICPSAMPDASVLSTFLSSGPRYGPGLGAAVRLEGPAFFHAGVNAQGSAGPDGRGVLLNIGSPSGLFAGEQGQAFSESGLAGALLGGPSVLRLEARGHARFDESTDLEAGNVTGLEGPEAGLTQLGRHAVLVTAGSRDMQCHEPETCGGGGFMFPEDPAASPSSPNVRVEISEDLVFEAQSLDVAVDLDGTIGPGIEVVAIAAAFPDENPNGEGCSGRPLAAPAIVHEGSTEDPSFNFAMDLSLMVAGTDPLLPAGCTEVHVFARSAGSEWGHGSTDVVLLPPPRIPFDPKDAVDLHARSSMDLSMRVPEPLLMPLHLKGQPPDVRFRMNGPVVEDINEWALVGSRLQVVDWGSSDDLPAGSYRLQVGFKWDGMTQYGEWVDLLPVNVLELTAAVDLSDEVPNPYLVSKVPSASTPVQLHGTANNVADLAFRLRSLDDQGNLGTPEQLQQGQDGICTAQEQDQQVANLDGALQDLAWDATLCLPSNVFAGSFVVEHNVNFDNVDQGWGAFTDANGNQQEIILVQDPPYVESVMTPDDLLGTRAAGNQNDPVGVCVQVRHAGDNVGVAANDVGVSVLRWEPDGNISRLHVERAPHLDPEAGSHGRCAGASGPREVFGYQWYDADVGEAGELEAGDYYVNILVRDGIGALFDSTPGLRFPIDREDPRLNQPGFQLPAMTPWPDATPVLQKAVKPGDEIQVAVRVEDNNLHGVRSFVQVNGGGEYDIDLLVEPEGLHEGTLVVPQDPRVDADGLMSIRIEAMDLAGNNAMLEVGKVRFQQLGFDFAKTPDGQDNITVVERSRSVEVEWVLDRVLGRPGDGMQAILQDANGNDLIMSDDVDSMTAEPPTYQVQFDDLDPDTTYHVVLRLWDAANFTLQSDPIVVRTLGLPIGSDVVLVTDDGPTYSDTVRLDGHLLAGASTVTGHLSLHMDDRHAEPADVWACEADPGGTPGTASFPVTVARGQRADFCFQWDSQDRVQAGTGADEVTLYMRFTDGSATLRDNVTLRIDNTKPGLALDVFGPEANQGWYNGTIVAGAAVEDDTPPFSYLVEAEHDGKATGPRDRETVTLNEDGLHDLNFTVWDGAVPPNVAHLEATVRVDRTLPALNVTSGLPERWTNETLVPFQVTASDAGSGLDGYRVRVGDGPWSPWTQVAPEGTSLEGRPDGEQWIDVQVRDAARNVRLESLSVILDRTPPELVDARWVGWTQESAPQPVLHVVAQDLLDGEGMPSGVDAIRFAFNETGPWTDWSETGSSGTFAINETAPGANETHAVWVQLRDRASNVGNAVLVDEPLAERHEADPDVDLPGVPASALLRAPSFAPERGTPETPFLFSVRVHPLGGAMPDHVVLNVAGNTYSMEPEGPVLEAGARLYTATVMLPPTDFESPHSFTMVAVHGTHAVESSSQPGPMVVKLGHETDSVQVQDDANGFQIPGLSFVVITLVLVMLSVLVRDRPSIYASWRRKK